MAQISLHGATKNLCACKIENYTRLTWKLKFDCNSMSRNTASRDHMRLHRACAHQYSKLECEC